MRIISSLKSNTASGPDGILSVMLKSSAGSICSYISTLMNCSSLLAESHRIGRLWILPQYSNQVNRLSFPTIGPSLCCPLSQRFGSVWATMLHVLQHDFLSARQFGFRPGSSTQEAILSATRDWHEILERKGTVVCVFLDLSKAFDSLPHSLILESLASAGVSGVLYNWLADYLKNRRQRMVLDGVN